MTNFVTAPKSGSSWTTVELKAFNINIVNQNSADFFGVDPLPAPNVPDAILNTPQSTQAVGDTKDFLLNLEDAMYGPYESEVNSFAIALFRLMGYERTGYRAKFNVDLSFKMCDKNCKAETDICIMDVNHILLVVQEDKQNSQNPKEELPVGQLVAECIAAFCQNNLRLELTGKKPLSDYLMPGIIMRGTTPCFYKMKITQDLVDCIEKGERPMGEPTKVFQHIPGFPSGPERGMIDTVNRLVALKCYEAFKVFVFQTFPV